MDFQQTTNQDVNAWNCSVFAAFEATSPNRTAS
jgi:hypothetical protein